MMELVLQQRQIDKTDVITHGTEDKIDEGLQKKIGHWNDDEQKKYVIFIDFFKKQLNSKIRRRSNKLFKIMANFIQTRNSVQCRCHHTKLIRTFKYINKIVKNYQCQVGDKQYSIYQKQMIQNYPIFNVNSKEFKKATRIKLGKQKPRYRNMGTQTDQAIFEQYEIGLANGQIDNGIFQQFFICNSPYYMLYNC